MCIFFSLEYIFNVFHSIFSYSFMFVIQYIMPLCVVISFIYSVAILVQSIVYEKEQRLKEVMKMMGLSNAVHWTAWFITSIVSMLTIVILLTIVLKVGDTVVFCFLFFFIFFAQVIHQNQNLKCNKKVNRSEYQTHEISRST